MHTVKQRRCYRRRCQWVPRQALASRALVSIQSAPVHACPSLAYRDVPQTLIVHVVIARAAREAIEWVYTGCAA